MRINVHTPELNKNLAKMVSLVQNKKGFVLLWAQAAAREARENARRKGGRRWWRDLARSVQVRSVSDVSAEVSSNQVGATQKQYGGVIRAVRAKALTIPIDEESRGKRAYELERPDRPLFVPKGTNLLGYDRGKKKGFKALYVLVKEVTQKPDPWFPSDTRVAHLAEEEASRMLAKEAKKWEST